MLMAVKDLEIILSLCGEIGIVVIGFQQMAPKVIVNFTFRNVSMYKVIF